MAKHPLLGPLGFLNPDEDDFTHVGKGGESTSEDLEVPTSISRPSTRLAKGGAAQIVMFITVHDMLHGLCWFLGLVWSCSYAARTLRVLVQAAFPALGLSLGLFTPDPPGNRPRLVAHAGTQYTRLQAFPTHTTLTLECHAEGHGVAGFVVKPWMLYLESGCVFLPKNH